MTEKQGWPVIMFEYFEKPMSSNLVVQARSVLSEESKVSSLAEEFVRRLKNTQGGREQGMGVHWREQ